MLFSKIYVKSLRKDNCKLILKKTLNAFFSKAFFSNRLTQFLENTRPSILFFTDIMKKT